MFEMDRRGRDFLVVSFAFTYAIKLSHALKYFVPSQQSIFCILQRLQRAYPFLFFFAG
jgi:hypothetical protein